MLGQSQPCFPNTEESRALSGSHIQTSKFLSLILRHAPEVVGISLDAQGRVSVDLLLDAIAQHRSPVSRELLEQIVFQDDK